MKKVLLILSAAVCLFSFSAADIEKKLHGYKDGTFGGAGKQVMQGIAKGLSDDQMKSLASHAATL